MTVSPYKKIKRYILVPCGKCSACVATKRDNLAFRLDAEHNALDNLFSLFVTLTYNDENLPIGEASDGSIINPLSGDDIHRFFKYLRKISKPLNFTFKYFLCGEYGDSFGRPHYHAIFFVKSIMSNRPLEDITSLIKKSWYRGFVSVQYPRNGFSAFGYVTKYVIKNTKYILNEYYRDNKPFIRMSNGIGLSNILRYDFKPNSTLIVSDSADRKHMLPRYYLNHIFDDVQKWQHHFYKMQFIEDKFIQRMKSYCMTDAQLNQYDWDMRKYQSMSNLFKYNQLDTDDYYLKTYQFI